MHAIAASALLSLDRLVPSQRTVEADVCHVLLKLDIRQTEEGHRRVLAVLTHLREANEWH